MVEAVRFKDKAAARAAVERLIQERAEGGRNRLDEALAIVRAWELDEDAVRELFKEADEVGRAAQAQIWIEGQEALLKNSAAQPERVAPKVEVVKPAGPKAVVEWRQRSDGGWEYRLEGESMYRRHLGPPPKHVAALALPKPKPEPEPQEEQPKKAAAEPEKDAVVGRVPAVVPVVEPAEWSDAIAAMNRQHAIVENVGGKAVIASWEPSSYDPRKMVIVFQNKESFLLRYSNRFVPVQVYTARAGVSSVVRVPLGQWWLAHPHRQQYRGILFRPNGAKVINESLNLWQGWGVEARPGDWSLIRRHIEEVIAGGNNEFGDYVVRWNAWAAQHPDEQAEVALVLIGLKGAGKGTLVRCLQRIFGAHAFQVTSREEVIGKFNGHLQDCVLFVADEAYWGGDKRCVGRLQGMITEPTLPIERKGIDLIQVPNYLHVVMLAEPGWVIPAGRYERRYAALAVAPTKRGDKVYFRALHRQIAEGGAEAMLYDLQRMDLGDWHPREIPEALLSNPALQKQQGFTLPPLEQWFVSLLHDGKLPNASSGKPHSAFTKDLLDDAKQRVPRLKWDLSDVGLRNFLVDEEAVGIACSKYRTSFGNGWSFAPLLELREAWCRRYGPTKWDNPEALEWGWKKKAN